MHSIFARLHRRFGHRTNIQERAELIDTKLRSAPPLPKVTPQARAFALSGTPRPKVAIVGGGFSGLMAGYTLRGDCDVTVFEARPRVGGRVWTKTKSSGLIEAGGELIGYNHPLWLKLAREFQLGFSINTSEGNYETLKLDMPLYLDGKKLSDKDAEGVYDDMDAAFGQMSRQATGIDANRPWLAANAKKLDDKPLSEWIASRRYHHRLSKVAMEQQFSNDAGVPSCQQSFLANLAAVAGGALEHHIDAFFTQSETLRCSEGNDSLAKRLAAEIEAMGGSIRKCSPVRAIRIDKQGVTLDYGSGRPSGDDGQECIISDADTPQSFAADYVILAIPPSLWPAASHPQIRISPALPSSYYVSMGTAVKYLSPLKGRFWIGGGLAPSATSDRFGVTWEGTDNQIASPERGVELSLFAGSGLARAALSELKSGGKPAVDRFYAAKIGAIYPDYAQNLSGEPDFMAWPEDPWTRAGYSFPAPGEVTRAGPLLHAAFEKRMFFAGEHTCFAYIGYMEGALQSGQRAGAAIVSAIKATARVAATRRAARGPRASPACVRNACRRT
jgi:monoamine oxidase